MQSLTRRRFLAISACAGAMGTQAFAGAEITQWRTKALGAQMTLSLAHPDAKDVADFVFAELRRLEGIFSLYQSELALSRLNREGALAAPPFELLECLGLAARVHDATGGLFGLRTGASGKRPRPGRDQAGPRSCWLAGRDV